MLIHIMHPHPCHVMCHFLSLYRLDTWHLSCHVSLTWHVSYAMCHHSHLATTSSSSCMPLTMTLGPHYAKCHHAICHMACVIMSCVTRPPLSRKTRNPDNLEIQRNLFGQLDFARRIQRSCSFHHPRSRKFLGFQPIL